MAAPQPPAALTSRLGIRVALLLDALSACPKEPAMPVLATIVPDGAIREDHLGLDRSLLTYPDGTVRFRHLCDRSSSNRGVVVCAPALMLGQGHTLTRGEHDAPTVRASIVCDDCGTHGFVTDGRWEPC